MKIVVAFFFVLLSCHAIAESAFETYKKARWEQRIFLIHAPDKSSAQFKKFQTQVKSFSNEIKDRDLITLHADAPLRKRFQLPENTFSLVLIGKDGTAKARQTNDIALKKLFALIDTMPMRQAEMQRK